LQLVNPESIDQDAIHVVAAIIWKSDDRQTFLIARRQQGKHLAHYWELPGGKVEAGETRWQALQRELKEEINILATAAEPYMQVYHPYADRKILLDVWQVTAYSGLVSAREQQQLTWINIDQIDGYRFPPADNPVLEAIANNRLTETKPLP